MENTFDMAYNTYNGWSFDQCARMLNALKIRLAEEHERTLEAAGLIEEETLYQPVTQEQFRRELLDAQAAYRRGDSMDALDFCAQIEQSRV